MVQSLPRAEVVRRFTDEAFDPHSPVWVLRWPAAAGERLWELPRGLSVVGGPPHQLGVALRREGQDSYAVRLWWEQTQLSWPAVSRVELLGSCLAPVLKAVGLDLWSLLQQPVAAGPARQWAA